LFVFNNNHFRNIKNKSDKIFKFTKRREEKKVGVLLLSKSCFYHVDIQLLQHHCLVISFIEVRPIKLFNLLRFGSWEGKEEKGPKYKFKRKEMEE
jgi:hypothetical protein